MKQAAILNILIKTRGAREAARDLRGVDVAGRQADDGTSRAASGMDKASEAAVKVSGRVRGARSELGGLGKDSDRTASRVEKLNSATERLGRFKKVQAELGAKVDSRAFDRYNNALDKARREARDESAFKAKLGADFDPAAFREYNREVEKSRKSNEDLNTSLLNVNQSFTGMGNAIKLVKFPAMIVGAGAAAEAVNALAAGGIALGSALAPAAGAMAAYPALFLAGGQAMGVAKLATQGIGKAVGGLNTKLDQNSSAFKKLSPTAKQFALTLEGLKKPFRDLPALAQKGLLPGLTAGIKDASKNIGVLKPIISGTAQALGGLARRAGDLVGGKGFGKDLATVGKRNITIIQTLGVAALHMADALRHVVVAAGPLVSWMVSLAGKAALLIDRQAKAARESGKLAGFFERTRAVLTQLGKIVGNVAVAFFNIGRAAAPLGQQILADIVKLTEKFRDWTKSMTGQRTLAQYFADAKGPLYEAAGLIGDLGKAFFAIGRSQNLQPLLKQLRDLVPVIQGVITSTSASFGPVLIDALGNVVRLFGSLAGTSGPLNNFVSIIGFLSGALADLGNTSPGVHAVLVDVLGFAAILKALKWTAAITGLSTLGGAVKTTAFAYRELAAGATLAATAEKRGVAATVAATVATWALDAAMTALPFIAVAAGMAAVGAAFYLAYKKVQPFHDAVNATFEFIKAHWPLLISILTGPFGVAVALIIKNAGHLRDVLAGVWRSISGTASAAWNGMKTGVVASWGAMRKAALDAWRAVRDTIGGVLRGALGVMTGVFGTMRRAVATAFDAMKSRALDAWRAVRDAVPGIISGLLKNLQTGFSAIISRVGGWGTTIKNKLVNAFFGAADAVLGFIRLIAKAINLIPGIPNIDLKSLQMPGSGGSNGTAGGGLPANQGGRLARGGAFGRTGGLVNHPITMMGEEAPLHPEYVIPTNPAYRSRAKGLLSQAAGAIGMAQGGIYSFTDLEKVWVKAGGARGAAGIMAHIAQAESAGNPRAHNASGATGLWQILGNPFPGNAYDPITNARMAIAKSGNGRNLHPWDASRAVWGKYEGHSGGFAGKVGHIVASAVGAVADAVGGVIAKLPGIGKLPDWMKGTGKYVLGKAKDYITDKAASVVGFGGGGGGGAMGKPGGGGTGTFDGITTANWIIPVLNWARSHGWGGHITSGFRPGSITTSGNTSNHSRTAYPGGAVDVGGPDAVSEGRALWNVVKNYPGSRKLLSAAWGPGAWTGYNDSSGYHVHDYGHFSATGHAKGGVYGKYMGAYETGGVLPHTGLYMGHAGETVIPAKASKAAKVGFKKGGINAFKKGGINVKSGIGLAVDAAYKAGFRGQTLINMVAIAGRESSFSPGAHNNNRSTGDDSYGLWQINVLPGANPQYKNRNLRNPYVNARTAHEMFQKRGYGPWKGVNYGSAPSFLAAATKAVTQYAGGKGAGGDGSAGPTGPLVYDPIQGKYVGTGIKVAKGIKMGKSAMDRALKSGIVPFKRSKKGAKVRGWDFQHNKAFTARGNKPPNRGFQLVRMGNGKEAYVNSDYVNAIVAQAGLTRDKGDDVFAAGFASRFAGLQYHAAVQSGNAANIATAAGNLSSARSAFATARDAFTGAGSATDAAAGGPSINEEWRAAAAEAALTPGKEDDLRIAEIQNWGWAQRLAAARASGDPSAIADAAEGLKAASDAVEALRGEIQDAAAAQKAHTDALTALTAEIKRQSDLAVQVSATDDFQLKKMLADVLGGQIVGWGAAAKAFTPGVGVAHEY